MIEPGADEISTPGVQPRVPWTPPGMNAPEQSTATDAASAPVEGEQVLTKRGKSMARFLIALVILVLAGGAYFFIAQARNGGDSSKIQGKVALSEQELRDVILAKKLTVYWAGPLTGAKYTLIATTPGIVYVRYLPGGVGLNDTKTLFRAIGTYTQKNAFAVSQNAGKADGNVGFISADGDAVFYAKGRPTNVYIGIKGKDIQVEVFDPVVDQALGLVLVRGQITLIK